MTKLQQNNQYVADLKRRGVDHCFKSELPSPYLAPRTTGVLAVEGSKVYFTSASPEEDSTTEQLEKSGFKTSPTLHRKLTALPQRHKSNHPLNHPLRKAARALSDICSCYVFIQHEQPHRFERDCVRCEFLGKVHEFFEAQDVYNFIKEHHNLCHV